MKVTTLLCTLLLAACVLLSHGHLRECKIRGNCTGSCETSSAAPCTPVCATATLHCGGTCGRDAYCSGAALCSVACETVRDRGELRTRCECVPEMPTCTCETYPFRQSHLPLKPSVRSADRIRMKYARAAHRERMRRWKAELRFRRRIALALKRAREQLRRKIRAKLAARRRAQIRADLQRRIRREIAKARYLEKLRNAPGGANAAPPQPGPGSMTFESYRKKVKQVADELYRLLMKLYSLNLGGEPQKIPVPAPGQTPGLPPASPTPAKPVITIEPSPSALSQVLPF